LLNDSVHITTKATNKLTRSNRKYKHRVNRDNGSTTEDDTPPGVTTAMRQTTQQGHKEINSPSFVANVELKVIKLSTTFTDRKKEGQEGVA